MELKLQFLHETFKGGRDYKQINWPHAYKSFKIKWKQKKNKITADSIINSILTPLGFVKPKIQLQIQITQYL